MISLIFLFSLGEFYSVENKRLHEIIYTLTVAAETLKPSRLFLLAPAFYLPGYQRTEFNPPAEHTLVIHGWQDDIVPPENSWRFCQTYHVCLKMLNADHRLISQLPVLADEFDRFLTGLMSSKIVYSKDSAHGAKQG